MIKPSTHKAKNRNTPQHTPSKQRQKADRDENKWHHGSLNSPALSCSGLFAMLDADLGGSLVRPGGNTMKIPTNHRRATVTDNS